MGWLMQVLSVRGAQKSANGSLCAVQTHGGDRSHGYRILTAHDSEFCFTWCTRPNRGLRAGARDPQPPTTIAPTGTKPRRSVVVARL